MKQALDTLPKTKQEELTLLTELLSGYKDVEMVILFGSYATGKWVEDKYVEKGITYEYRSDYDLLVVITHEDLKLKFRIEEQVKNELLTTGKVTTPVNMIFHGIKHLNKALTEGNYFFKDIKKEGIVLYDSLKFRLATPKVLSPAESRQKAQGYFDQWFESANVFYEDFEANYNKATKGKVYLNKAAFELHQAVERYYTAVLLVFTDYRPKDHNIETLGIKAEMCDKRFAVFPQQTPEEQRLFELLKKAYIDARYKMDEYAITAEELLYLAERVNKLKQLTETICIEKIAEIGAKESL
ncbi:HEPN domain-containing protein [Fulvivirga kasyanovii]|uniref:HEPN domain-containing protein n=1 Tax=Fulvivirga kasyanovii TaxID=396812 RepID=A0ABW9RLI3_9BACT|nr:HEPN domain-containing protein [Fulvivirga kasyanovii]